MALATTGLVARRTECFPSRVHVTRSVISNSETSPRSTSRRVVFNQGKSEISESTDILLDFHRNFLFDGKMGEAEGGGANVRKDV
jgi:hypothetical protein